MVVLFDVDNTLLDNDRIAADLTRHLDEEIGTRGERRYWAIFEELRARSGVRRLSRRLAAVSTGLSARPHLLTLSRFLLNYPFAERLFPQNLRGGAEDGRVEQPVILSDGDVVFQPRKDRSLRPV